MMEAELDRIIDEGKTQITRDYYNLFSHWVVTIYAKGKTLEELKKADGRDVANGFIQNID
jgi:E3 ubiquitin-protein ligase DOA10